MQRLFWDTNQYIYLFEKNPVFYPAVLLLRQRMVRRQDELITSTVTLGEVQVKALAIGRVDLANDLKDRVVSTSLIVSFDQAASDAYAHVRATTGIKGPDALQLACAIAAGVDYFVTNDNNLHKHRLPGIGRIVSAGDIP